MRRIRSFFLVGTTLLAVTPIAFGAFAKGTKRSAHADRAPASRAAAPATAASAEAPPASGGDKRASAPKRILQLATTAGSGCVLLARGEVRCWGNFRTGAGTATSALGTVGKPPPGPIVVPELAGAERIGVGFQLVCAEARGSMKCMGDNQGGRLGIGTIDPSEAPREIHQFRGVSRFDAASLHTCAVTTAGSIWCWGYNAAGEVGDGSTRSQSRPVRVAVPGHAIDVAVGDEFSCAVVRGGDVYCWGLGDAGQLGASPANKETCAIPEDGDLPCARRPIKLAGLPKATAVTAGERHACALLEGGGVRCWGDNSSWQLGGERKQALVDPGVVGAKLVRAGSSHTCAVLTDGRVSCWGWNKDGQLGDGSRVTRKEPTLVPNLDDVVEVSPSYLSTCARTKGDELYCWGDNRWGQLGLPGEAHRLTPTKVELK